MIRISLFLFMVALGIASLGLTIYGAYLAFTASILLGIVALFVEPAPLVFGAAMLFWKVNLPVMIVAWLAHH